MSSGSTYPTDAVMFAGDPLWRWKSIHHTFFVLVEGITVAASRFSRFQEQGDDRKAERCLARIEKLLRASAAAMRLAGSMSLAQYTNEVRPDMAPPIVPDEFSGIQGEDHKMMLLALRAVRNTLETHPQLHAQLEAAIDYCYDQHAHVCRFVVRDGMSLLSAENGDRQEGVETLEPGGRYRKRTKALIYPPVKPLKDAP